MAVRRNIEDIYAVVWGRAPFPVLVARAIKDKSSFTSLIKKKPQEYAVPEVLIGRAVLSDLELELPDGERFVFPVPPMLTLRGTKRIKEVDIAGGQDGTISQIINNGDYQITLQGFLVQEDVVEVVEDTESGKGFRYTVRQGRVPEQQLRAWRRMVESKSTLKVANSYLLSLFNVNRLVVLDWSLPEVEGMDGVLPFEITAKQERQVKLRITE